MRPNPLFDIIRSRAVDAADRLLGFLKKWAPQQIYLSALLIFATSRAVVVLGVNFGASLVTSPVLGKWDGGDAWYYRLLRWDSGWFSEIMNHGYHFSDNPSVQSPAPFFPLYPLIADAVRTLLGTDEYLALLLVANVASLVAALSLTKLVKRELGEQVALLSVSFFSFFPFSLFLSAGYSEPLCLMFVLLSFVLLTRKKFTLAAAIAGLASATRSTGIVMVPVIVWEVWRRNTAPGPQMLARMALCGALAASGLLAYAVYLGINFGRPFAFATGHEAWQGGTLLLRFASAATLVPFRHFDFADGGWLLCFLALTLWSFWRLPSCLSLYALGSLALPYFSLGITGSMNRFVLMCFPALICLAALCNKRPWLAGALIGIFAALLLRNTALFSQWYWVG